MPLRYIPALLIMACLIGTSGYFYKIESAYINDMEIIEGTVAKLGSKSTSTVSSNSASTSSNTQAIVNFKVNDINYTAEGRALGYPRWIINQKTEVFYSADDPTKSRINRWDEVYFFTAICAFFLIAGLLMATINFIFYKITGKPFS